MFALRGMAVSLSVFAIVYCVFSIAVCLSWRRVRSWAQHNAAHRMANLLFAMRMLPFAAAITITAAFTIPSFVLLEPRAIDEPIGAPSLALGIFGAALGIIGLSNTLMAVCRAQRTVTAWTQDAQLVDSSSSLPVLRISTPAPPLSAVGIVRPKILLSASAEFALTSNELRTALNHEAAHVRRSDNLRKLLLRLVIFPGMRGLETAWLEAAEMAADDAAVSTSSEALDLAAALIKLSRLAPVEPPPDFAAALVHSPASIMNVRIERLISWSPNRRVETRPVAFWYTVASACATMAAFALTYGQLLLRVHTATEWLVR